MVAILSKMEDGDTGLAPRISDPESLESVIAELSEIDRRSGLERTLDIGELILNRFFGGDPAVWRDRRRNKNNSIRRLAERTECPLGRSALNESVAVYVAVRDMPSARTSGHNSSSHIAAVLALPAEEREEMLTRSDAERWSVRRLRDEVVAKKREEGERRGRPPASVEGRIVSTLSRSANHLRHAVDELGQVGPQSDVRPALLPLADEFMAIGTSLRRLCNPQ